MPVARLYMHEFIHIVGAGAQRYMEMTREWAAERRGRGGNRLVGTWAAVGATGNWPEVVNLWELTLEDWYGMLDRSYIHRDANAHLGEWWARALQYRSGGRDRMLVPAPWSPSLDDLVARAVRGVLFVQELSSVRAGMAPEYLAAMEREWVPLLDRLGLAVVGAFEGLTTDTEVLALWAVPDLDAYRRYLECRLDAPGFADWRRRSREWVTSWQETLWHPAAGTPLAAERSP
jgi:hypothetical protein